MKINEVDDHSDAIAEDCALIEIPTDISNQLAPDNIFPQVLELIAEEELMNVQLVKSLVQVILALSEEEQAVLSKKLAKAQLVTTHSSQPNHTDSGEQILQSLIAEGRIILPTQHPDIPALSEADLKVMVSNIQISGKPLSETMIEERGEW